MGTVVEVFRKSRRKNFILLCVALASLLCGGLLLLASAQSPDLPSDFTLPPPHVGDRGRFTGLDASGYERLVADFEWLPDELVRAADGSLRRANVLRYVQYEPSSRGDYVAIERVVLFESGTQRIFATRTGNAWGSDESSAIQFNHTQTIYHGLDAPLRPVLCGLRNSLQGHRTPFPAAVSLGDGCVVDGQALPDEPVRLVADAVGETIDGQHRLVRASLEQAAQPLRVWFASNTPYPVRFESGDDDRLLVRLAAFERGTFPVDTARGPRVLAPPLEWKPWLPWGIDDAAATEHPWPLSAAYRWMVEEAKSGGGDVRDFLASHPNAFLYFAQYGEHITNPHSTYIWDVAFTDGRDWIRRCAVHEAQHWTRQTVYTGTVLDGPTVDQTFYDDSCPVNRPGETSALPPTPPASIPTLASLQERWRLHAGHAYAGHQPNAWSLEVRCEGWSCNGTELRIGVGINREVDLDFQNRTTGLTWNLAPYESGKTYSMLLLNEDEQALVMQESHEGTGETLALTLPNSDEAPPAQPSDSSIRASTVIPLPWTDTLGVALASTGVAVLAVGVGIWAWPTLQGAFIGAFTRLHKDTAAEHPTRAAMLDLLDQNPGLHLQEIRRRLNLANGPAIHHLEKLVRLGLLTTVVAPGYTCYFPKGKVQYRVMAATPALKAEAARTLLESLHRTPATSATELALRMNMNPRRVGYHLHRMRDSGLVEFVREGRRALVRPTPLGVEAIAPSLALPTEIGRPTTEANA